MIPYLLLIFVGVARGCTDYFSGVTYTHPRPFDDGAVVNLYNSEWTCTRSEWNVRCRLPDGDLIDVGEQGQVDGITFKCEKECYRYNTPDCYTLRRTGSHWSSSTNRRTNWKTCLDVNGVQRYKGEAWTHSGVYRFICRKVVQDGDEMMTQFDGCEYQDLIRRLQPGASVSENGKHFDCPADPQIQKSEESQRDFRRERRPLQPIPQPRQSFRDCHDSTSTRRSHGERWVQRTNFRMECDDGTLKFIECVDGDQIIQPNEVYEHDGKIYKCILDGDNIHYRKDPSETNKDCHDSTGTQRSHGEKWIQRTYYRMVCENGKTRLDSCTDGDHDKLKPNTVHVCDDGTTHRCTDDGNGHYRYSATPPG